MPSTSLIWRLNEFMCLYMLYAYNIIVISKYIYIYTYTNIYDLLYTVQNINDDQLIAKKRVGLLMGDIMRSNKLRDPGNPVFRHKSSKCSCSSKVATTWDKMKKQLIWFVSSAWLIPKWSTMPGGWYTYPSEKYEFVSWDDMSNIWKNKSI